MEWKTLVSTPLINFYRRHISNLAAIARPLTALTCRDKKTGGPVVFEWITECEASFRKLKELLITAPLLHPPDLSKEFYLWTDACKLGFGAVLEQEGEDGHRHPIAFASRQTNEAERKYAPTEMEVTALVFAVEHFEVYLLGNKTIVYTDHQALVSAFLAHMKSQTKGLLARWYLRFLPNLRLEYKPGSTNTAADALSRSPVSVLHISNKQPLLTVVQQEQQKDSELLQLIMYLQNKTLPKDTAVARQVVEQAGKGFYLVDGVLYYQGQDMPDRCRLVVPQQLQQQVLNEHHDSIFAGHFGIKKMTQRLSQYYYWKGMKADVHKKCTSCVTCASVSGQGHRSKPPLKSITVGGAFECLGMDFKEMDLSHSGNRYALVFQDYLSKWP